MEDIVSKEPDLNLPHAPLPTIQEDDDNEVEEQEFEIPNTTLTQRASNGRPLDSSMDRAKLKKIVAGRQYSQKYRLKQIHHVARLEHDVEVLQTEVSISRPRIGYVRSHNALVREENESLKQKLAAKSGELLLKQALFEELKKEKEAFEQKNKEKMIRMKQELTADFLTVGLAPTENYEHLDANLNPPSFDLCLGPSCSNNGGESPRDDHQLEDFNMNHHDFI